MTQKITVDLVAETARLRSGINEAQGLLDGLGGRMKALGGIDLGAVGRNLTFGVTLPLVGVAAAGLKTAAEFEVSMASLGVNAGIAGKDLDSLGDLAIKLGADTVFSANEAAAAMLELSKSGMAPASISGGALAATLDLAATEGIDLAEAATIMANTMNTFSIRADQSAKVTDLLAAGAVASTAGVRDLAAGLKYVGTTASTLNIPLDDTVTALAAMNNAGIDSSTAGTSLNRFFLGLIPMTKKAQDELDYLDITFQNLDGSMKSMPEIIDTLTKSMDGYSDANKVASLKQIFGVEGMRAAATLMKLNSDGYKDLNDQVNKNGVASDLANARMSGLSGALEQFAGSADTAALKIGSALAPAISAAALILTDLINKFTALSPEMQTSIVVAAGVVAILGPLLIVIASVAKAVITLKGVFLGLKILMGKATIVTALLSLTMKAIPILAIIGLIVLLIQNWDTVIKVVGNVGKALFEWGKNAVKAIGDAVKGIGDFLGNLAKRFGDMVKTIINFFLDIPKAMLDIGKNIVEGLWKGIQGAAGWLKNNMLKFFGDLVPGWAKGILGIKSPSTVFEKIGKNITQGVGAGLSVPRVMTPSRLTPSRLGAGGSGPNITINAGLGTDPYALGRTVASALNKQGRVSSPRVVRR